jgi:hypothetical protein
MEEILSLNEAQLLELCSYWEWRSELASRDSDRWWCWTIVRFARQVLAVRRGYHPHGSQSSCAPRGRPATNEPATRHTA